MVNSTNHPSPSSSSITGVSSTSNTSPIDDRVTAVSMKILSHSSSSSSSSSHTQQPITGVGLTLSASKNSSSDQITGVGLNLTPALASQADKVTSVSVPILSSAINGVGAKIENVGEIEAKMAPSELKILQTYGSNRFTEVTNSAKAKALAPIFTQVKTVLAQDDSPFAQKLKDFDPSKHRITYNLDIGICTIERDQELNSAYIPEPYLSQLREKYDPAKQWLKVDTNYLGDRNGRDLFSIKPEGRHHQLAYVEHGSIKRKLASLMKIDLKEQGISRLSTASGNEGSVIRSRINRYRSLDRQLKKAFKERIATLVEERNKTPKEQKGEYDSLSQQLQMCEACLGSLNHADHTLIMYALAFKKEGEKNVSPSIEKALETLRKDIERNSASFSIDGLSSYIMSMVGMGDNKSQSSLLEMGKLSHKEQQHILDMIPLMLSPESSADNQRILYDLTRKMGGDLLPKTNKVLRVLIQACTDGSESRYETENFDAFNTLMKSVGINPENMIETSRQASQEQNTISSSPSWFSKEEW
ncbi:MAG: hypothetical protein ACOVOR_01935 [Rhabdochlamydiaceae bacterium]